VICSNNAVFTDELNLMTSHKIKLTNAQVTVIARRCGGKLIHNNWHFSTPKQRSRFHHLVDTQTHISLLSSIIFFFDDLLGWTSIVFVTAFAVCALALWCWGAYQALLWGQLISVKGTSILAAFHLTAAITWCSCNIFVFIHKLGNSAIMIIVIVFATLLFGSYYYVNHDAKPAPPQNRTILINEDSPRSPTNHAVQHRHVHHLKSRDG
jgi:hypothetical protein